MINTTNTKENIEQKENHKGTQFLEELSLRDYFAAKAMQEWVGVCDHKEGAMRAYKWADEMLEARK